MSTLSSSRRGKFLFVISWLLARLWWGFEMSKLTILRVRPKIVKIRLSRQQDTLPQTCWLLSRNMFTCVSVDEHNHQLRIKETPPIEMN